MSKLDISNVKSKKTITFLNSFLGDRNLNYEVYLKIPEEMYDKRLSPKSPSTRDNIIYQISIHKFYYERIKNQGILNFDKYKVLNFKKYSKRQLLDTLDAIDQQIINFLAIDRNVNKLVTVPWESEKIKAIMAYHGIINHEDYHLGRNSMMLEYLGIERFDSLKKAWG